MDIPDTIRNLLNLIEIQLTKIQILEEKQKSTVIIRTIFSNCPIELEKNRA